jgi:hypothetical protein
MNTTRGYLPVEQTIRCCPSDDGMSPGSFVVPSHLSRLLVRGTIAPVKAWCAAPGGYLHNSGHDCSDCSHDRNFLTRYPLTDVVGGGLKVRSNAEHWAVVPLVVGFNFDFVLADVVLPVLLRPDPLGADFQTTNPERVRQPLKASTHESKAIRKENETECTSDALEIHISA